MSKAAKTLNWNKIGSGAYRSADGQFQITLNCENGMWMLLESNHDAAGGWDWCQSYQLMRGAKRGAQYVHDTRSN